jgi:predicted transcriptional regulator YheO
VDELAALLRPVMTAMATAIGPHCEVVLHDLRRREMDRTILAIENGDVTGRTVGGPSTNLGLTMLQSEPTDHDEYGYPGRTADGRDLHCSSTYFRDAAGTVVAALCVNVDLTPFQALRGALDTVMPPRAEPEEVREVIGTDIETVLDDMIERAVAHVGAPVAHLGKHQRLEVFRYLEERGAFFVKRSVPRTAKRLGISAVTAYGYLDEIRNGR